MGGCKKMCLRSPESGCRAQPDRLYHVTTILKWPIIYCSSYNIKFAGMQRLHPFDSEKWGRVFNYLKDAGMVNDDTVVIPLEINEEELATVHTASYLNGLNWSINVARITEVPPVALLPNFLVQRKVLRPLRYQTGGTVLAGKLALGNGWAINIGGGFHHCSANNGGGFCAYADITLCIRLLFTNEAERVKKAMIVDLDAHQGNGHETDFKNDERVYIMDVYNRHIYPHDTVAKGGIRKRVELNCHVEDEEYLSKVERNLEESLGEFSPDVIIFNAGTDILQGDSLGLLSVSPRGVIKRDAIVFSIAKREMIPIVMVTSGGYQRETARVIADSIMNLRYHGLIDRSKDGIIT